jgi:hypothetical protein
MDRLKHARLASVGLGLILAASGCHGIRSDVPPGRQYMNDGRQVPPVGFSSDARPSLAPGMNGSMPGLVPSGPSSSISAPATGSSSYGAPTTNAYGPPVTASPSTSSLSGPMSSSAVDPATSSAGFNPAGNPAFGSRGPR